MYKTRKQLTLFVDKHQSHEIERIRKDFNPEQHALIGAHVTLCREDELTSIERVIENLSQLNQPPVTIRFGRPTRFSEGKGVLLPAQNDNYPFHKLRESILKGIIEKPRMHEPHITLMHPRNATCTDEIFSQIEKVSFPSELNFDKVSLIEQEHGKQWHVLKEFYLHSNVY